MARGANPDRVHTLEIPLLSASLLMPSTGIAEVSPLVPVSPLPLAPPWLLGAMAWRTLAVPVISFNQLLNGRREDVAAMSRLVVFYPLPGRADWEFFCVPAAGEPRPRAVDAAMAVGVGPADLPKSPYIAGGLRFENRILSIPNLDALKALLYPAA